MTTTGRRHPRRGYGLVEMLVTLSIMSIVMVGIFQVFQEGMQLFRTNAKAADAQRAAVKVLGLISSELVNATPEVAKHYPAGGAEPPGIVFATSLSDGGTAKFDDTTGEIYWRRYISYYFVPDPGGGSDGKIFRSVLPVADEFSGGPGDRNRTGAVTSFVDTQPTSVFQSHADAKQRLLSDGISGFDLSIYDGSEGRLTPETATQITYEITVEAGDPASRKLRNGYYIKVGSRVTPRG